MIQKMKKVTKMIWSSLFLLGLAVTPVFAQVEETVEEMEIEKVSMWEQLMQSEQGRLLLLIGGLLLVLIVLMVILAVLMLKTADLILNKKAAEKGEERLSFFKQFKQKWITGKFKPVDKQGDMMLDHNYDGIQEMDYS